MPLFRPRSATTSCWMTTTSRVRCQSYKTSFLCRRRKGWTGQIICPLQAFLDQPYVFCKARPTTQWSWHGRDWNFVPLCSVKLYREEWNFFSILFKYCSAPVWFSLFKVKMDKIHQQYDSNQSLMTLSQLMLI